MLDLILKNTVVYDGTGAPPFHGNIGIAQGKIAVLSQQPIAEKAKEIVDLGGLAAAPGFIDFHSHSDTTFLPDSRCQSKSQEWKSSNGDQPASDGRTWSFARRRHGL